MVPGAAANEFVYGVNIMRPLLSTVEPAEGVWDILPEEVRPDQSAPVERNRRQAVQPRLFPIDSEFVDDTRREASELIRKGRDGEVGGDLERLLWGELHLGLGSEGKQFWLPTASALAKAPQNSLEN
jgi:hypothetical protein